MGSEGTPRVGGGSSLRRWDPQSSGWSRETPVAPSWVSSGCLTGAHEALVPGRDTQTARQGTSLACGTRCG